MKLGFEVTEAVFNQSYYFLGLKNTLKWLCNVRLTLKFHIIDCNGKGTLKIKLFLFGFVFRLQTIKTNLSHPKQNKAYVDSHEQGPIRMSRRAGIKGPPQSTASSYSGTFLTMHYFPTPIYLNIQKNIC